MSLQIIGAGFGRTATDSTRAALNELGFPCYHMREVMRRRGHLGFWREVAAAPAGTQHDWQRVFDDFTATIDFPASCVWRELMAAYPDAKVLLTLHPAGSDAWYESTWETIYQSQRLWQFKVLEKVIPVARRFNSMVRDLVWIRCLESTMEDRGRAVDRYLENSEQVKAAVPADRLLVFQADQGWEPLCDFLGVPVPDTDFPRVNDRATMKRAMWMMKAIAYAILAVGAAAGVGIVVVLVSALR